MKAPVLRLGAFGVLARYTLRMATKKKELVESGQSVVGGVQADLPHDLVLPKRSKPEVVAPGPIKPLRSCSVAVIRTIKQRPHVPGAAGGFELQIEKIWVVDGNGDLWFKIGEDPWVFFM